MMHPSGVDLEKLDLEEVDKEMAVNKAAQSSTVKTDAPKNAPNTDGLLLTHVSQLIVQQIDFHLEGGREVFRRALQFSLR